MHVWVCAGGLSGLSAVFVLGRMKCIITTVQRESLLKSAVTAASGPELLKPNSRKWIHASLQGDNL